MFYNFLILWPGFPYYFSLALMSIGHSYSQNWPGEITVQLNGCFQESVKSMSFSIIFFWLQLDDSSPNPCHLFPSSHTHTLSIWYCEIYICTCSPHMWDICMWDIHTINDISIICEIDIYITNLPTQFIPNREMGLLCHLFLGLYKYLLLINIAVYWLYQIYLVLSQIPQHCHL